MTVVLVVGGSTLYIETSVSDVSNKEDDHHGSGSLSVTGHLGDVMKESSQIAYTFAKVTPHVWEWDK